MNAIIDNLSVTSEAGLLRTSVEGWLWMGEKQGEIVSVEAWLGSTVLGESDGLFLRPDVNTALGLNNCASVGFRFSGVSRVVAAGAVLSIGLRARFSNGDRSQVFLLRDVAAIEVAPTPLAALQHAVSKTAVGLEIGAHSLPTPGISPYYTDSVASYACTESQIDFLADGQSLPLADGSLDYLCSSHVLEHLPNPLAAIFEWHRVIRAGGFLYIVVPDKRYTFDCPRVTTSPSHIINDFIEAVTVRESREHLDEFIYQTDWGKLQPSIRAEDRAAHQASHHAYYLNELTAGRYVDIHFHTFTPESLIEVLEFSGIVGGKSPLFRIVSRAERYPVERADGIGLLLEKTGSLVPKGDLQATFSMLNPRCTLALPLVCPATLAPLIENQTPIGRILSTADKRCSYSFKGDFPALFPPAGVPVQRMWSSRSWRELQCFSA